MKKKVCLSQDSNLGPLGIAIYSTENGDFFSKKKGN